MYLPFITSLSGLALGAYLHDTLDLLWWSFFLDPVICVDTSCIKKKKKKKGPSDLYVAQLSLAYNIV